MWLWQKTAERTLDVFREVAEQILPILGIEPDIETKSAPDLIAEVDQDPERAAKLRDVSAPERARYLKLPGTCAK